MQVCMTWATLVLFVDQQMVSTYSDGKQQMLLDLLYGDILMLVQ